MNIIRILPTETFSGFVRKKSPWASRIQKCC